MAGGPHGDELLLADPLNRSCFYVVCLHEFLPFIFKHNNQKGDSHEGQELGDGTAAEAEEEAA
jgi:hypothetical protein